MADSVHDLWRLCVSRKGQTWGTMTDLHVDAAFCIAQEDYLFTQHKMRVVTTSMRKDEVLALQQRARVTAAKAVEADEAVRSLEGTAAPGALLPSPLGNGVQKVTGVLSQTYSSTASALASATGKYSLPWASSDSSALGKRGAGAKSAEGTAEGKESGKAAEGSGKEEVGEEEEATCPCHWYVCDEVKNGTRHFIIQGSESLASWQANLTFDPVPFEDKRLGVMVHRGIYIAAKALYRDLLPLIRSHIAVQGRQRAKIQLAGHSLGGSLSTLLCLMLHLRGEVAPHNMLPVYTFGAPSIMCGGDQLLATLGLPKDHVRQIVMHRDLVPRAFACEYPGHIAQVLRRVSGALRNHPCLLSQVRLQAPLLHSGCCHYALALLCFGCLLGDSIVRREGQGSLQHVLDLPGLGVRPVRVVVRRASRFRVHRVSWYLPSLLLALVSFPPFPLLLFRGWCTHPWDT